MMGGGGNMMGGGMMMGSGGGMMMGGNGMMGCSSGGAAALTAGWFRPDLFRRLITYSGTFVDQQDDDARDRRGDRTHQERTRQPPP